MSATTHGTEPGIFAPGLIREVATMLMGESNAQLSSGGNTRYGTNGSLSIKVDDNTFYDHEQQSGGGLLDLICREAGLSAKSEAITWLKTNSLMPPEPPKVKPRFVVAYDYRDEAGDLLFQVARYEPKTFKQRRPTASGDWEYTVKGTRQVPYCLPELLESPADTLVYIVEGEKDVLRLAGLGIIATCNAGGAGKWRDAHAEHLAGRSVVVLPDNDDAGRKHAQQVAKTLNGIAANIVILDLPGLPEKGDVSDWLDAGGTAEALADLANAAPEPTAQPPAIDNDEAPFGSELQLSDEFARNATGFIRWTPGLEWMVNNGTHWEKDNSLKRFTEAKSICKNAAIGDINPKVAAKICSAGTHSAILSLARSSPGIVTGIDEWDKYPMLLNTPNAAIDLETGREVSRDGLLFTQVAGTSPSDMPTPIWDKFISEVFDGDLEMVEFMQRMGGYSLTGSIKEQKLFFMHGNGANGKSVFLDVMRALGGKYSYNLPSEALMTSKHESHPTMLASLHGKRLAVSSEIEESAHWAEARIKAMTGDETMTARYMRQDFFEFKVTHKHIIAGNFKPRLKGDDFAMVRRMVLIPFTQRFEGTRRDNNLPEKLKAEYPGILAWFIEGSRKWAESGLAIPAAITEASREYMAEQDDIGLWVSSCCEKVKGSRELASSLFASFDTWKQRNGENAGSAKTFLQRLERTYDKKRVTRGMEFIGLRLLNDFEATDKTNAYEAASRGE
jgi:putative DNA primase/helicase